MSPRYATMWIVISLVCFWASPLPATGGQPPKVTFSATDGYWIHADYYAASSTYNEAAIAILVHAWDSDRSAWQPLLAPLHEAGFAVLALDLRGCGESATGQTRARLADGDAELARDMQCDLHGAYDWLAQQPGIDRARFAIIGAGAGADLALEYAARDRSVDAIVCISPGSSQPGLDPAGALGQIRGRHVLLLASEEEQAACRALAARGENTDAHFIQSETRGVALLTADPKSREKVLETLIRGVGKPSDQVVYGSIRSNIYHAANSGWLAEISPTNLRHFSSPQEAQARGLRASKSDGPRKRRGNRSRRETQP